jgi:GT2 family glycosyltransferase
MQISRSIKKFLKQKLKLRDSIKEPKTINLVREKIIFNESKNPTVSIIIPFYNQEKFTWNCLNYLNKNLSEKYPFEIILIDDNSPEAYDFSLIEGINLIKNSTNLGFLKNINKGITAAKGEYIYILNNDTEVGKYFLEELFFVFENFKNVGAVGSMLLNPDNTLQEAGSVFLKGYDIRQVVRNKKPHDPEVNYIYQVDYCSGCSLLFKRYKDDGVTLNLFDETFAPAYFEETDFCFDLKYKQNKNIYYTPFSKVLHYNGVSYNGEKKTSNKESEKRKENLFKVNKEKFANKWNPQIDAIQANNLEERIIEKYNNKSIAFVIKYMPEHDKDSGSNRLKEIIKGFLNNGYHVTLIVTKICHNDPYINFYQRLGVNVFYNEYRSKDDFIDFVIKTNVNVNLIWFYGPDTFKENYFKFKNILTNTKYIYDMVDIHHLRFLNAMEIDSKETSHNLNYEKYKEIETVFVKNADYVIPISENEKDYMKSFFDIDNLNLISNVHYPKIKVENLIPFINRKDIIFIGSTHHPNVNAINFLYNSIMPIVWAKLPEIKVNIVGNIDQVVKNIDDERFMFHGYVSDVENLFNNAKLMVAPLQIGAGVKGKIGQAFEYYLPVVTTAIGADGMFLVDNQNVLIADEANAFAEKVIQLYNDESIWNKLSQNSEKSLYPFSIEKLNKTITEYF